MYLCSFITAVCDIFNHAINRKSCLYHKNHSKTILKYFIDHSELNYLPVGLRYRWYTNTENFLKSVHYQMLLLASQTKLIKLKFKIYVNSHYWITWNKLFLNNLLQLKKLSDMAITRLQLSHKIVYRANRLSTKVYIQKIFICFLSNQPWVGCKFN